MTDLAVRGPVSLGGGSGALTRRVTDAEGDWFVKLVPDRADAVDGHEPETLLAKQRQVTLIHATCPSLAACTPRLIVDRVRSGIEVRCRFVVGTSPLDLVAPGELDALAVHLDAILHVLATAWSTRQSTPRQTAGEEYLGRLLRRAEHVGAHPGDPVAAECRDLLLATHAAAQAHARRAPVLGERLWFPAHGDLNLTNVIVPAADRPSVVLVDQRGITCPWDPIYDLGKMLLSLTIQVRTIGSSGAVDATRSAAAVEVFRRALLRWPFASSLASSGSQLWRRVLFAHAVHVSAESACRSSVARSPFCDDPGRQSALALAHARYGAALVDRLVADDDLCDFDEGWLT